MSAAPLDFTGRTAIVTGAATGLGRSYALWLAAHGCAVVVNNRARGDGTSSAQAVVDEIIAGGGRAAAHDGPVETEASGAGMVALAQERFGSADILICNAGVQKFRDFTELSLEEMRRTLDINLWGSLLPTKAIWPVMLGQNYGRIILTSSGAGLWGQTQSVDYAASKAAVVGVARSLAIDTPKGADIKINVIAPAAYTRMASGVIDAKWAEQMGPDKVAPVVGWLAHASCDVTGAIFHAGFGRVQRVRSLLTEPLELASGPTGEVVARLQGPREPGSAYGAGAVLMPELFAERARRG